MTARRKAREAALQSLFQSEFSDTSPSQEVGRTQTLSDDVASYSRILVEGVRNHLSSIDEKIQSNSHNWKVYRMALVDKNILRIAIFEMTLASEPIPAKAAINEAIELAKKFGSDESKAFINGILDQIAKSSQLTTSS